MKSEINKDGYLEDADGNEAPMEFMEHLAEDALKLDGLNDAIIGITPQGYIIYGYEKILDVFCKDHKMERMEAVEFTDFNVIGLEGNGNWVIMYERERFV
jgi:hypothetical protein